MSVYKTLTSQDIIVSPFEVNKAFTFTGGGTLLSESIQRNIGTNNPYDPYYNSIKQLYYSNYISGSEGEISNATTASAGSDGVLSGPTYNTLYQNYLSTDINPQRYFPTGSGDIIGILSIPQTLFGDYIQPSSLNIKVDGVSYSDDGEGQLYRTIFSYKYNYGNVIYEHGIIVLNNGAGINSFVSSSNIQVSFSSSYTLYETQYKCTFNENEFNYTLNPTVTSGSDGKLYNHFTGSYFVPYITTVGLYNDNEELMAIGKLAQPLPTSRTTDTTILINIDRL